MTWFLATSWFVQSPWMLLALLSIIVPILIHLLSKSKGKVVPFGNIKLLNVTKPIKMNEIRLVKRLLLLCRLLLLLFSVLLLAQLYYDNRASNNSNSEGNILVSQDWLNHASDTELQVLASKAETGVVVLLSSHSNALSSNDILTWSANQKYAHNPALPLKESKQQNTWQLVKNYSNTLANTTKITVYTSNQLSQFNGNKIALPNNVYWQIKSLPGDKLTDSFNALMNKKLSILIISDDERQKDVNYLNAAFSQIKNTRVNHLTFEFKKADFQLNNNDEKPAFDWIFYLSSTPVSKNIVQEVTKGSRLLIDAKLAMVNDTTSFTVEKTKQAPYLFEGFEVLKIAQPRLNIDKALVDELTATSHKKILWQGSSLLTQAAPVVLEQYSYSLGKVFAFYSRFNPLWNDLVNQVQFPQMLLSLLLNKPLYQYQQQQQLTNQQIETPISNNHLKNPYPHQLTTQFKNPLTDKFLILLIVLLWSIERILSEFNRVKTKNTSFSTSQSKASAALNVEQGHD